MGITFIELLVHSTVHANPPKSLSLLNLPPLPSKVWTAIFLKAGKKSLQELATANSETLKFSREYLNTYGLTLTDLLEVEKIIKDLRTSANDVIAMAYLDTLEGKLFSPQNKHSVEEDPSCSPESARERNTLIKKLFAEDLEISFRSVINRISRQVNAVPLPKRTYQLFNQFLARVLESPLLPENISQEIVKDYLSLPKPLGGMRQRGYDLRQLAIAAIDRDDDSTFQNLKKSILEYSPENEEQFLYVLDFIQGALRHRPDRLEYSEVKTFINHSIEFHLNKIEQDSTTFENFTDCLNLALSGIQGWADSDLKHFFESFQKIENPRKRAGLIGFPLYYCNSDQLEYFLLNLPKSDSILAYYWPLLNRGDRLSSSQKKELIDEAFIEASKKLYIPAYSYEALVMSEVAKFILSLNPSQKEIDAYFQRALDLWKATYSINISTFLDAFSEKASPSEEKIKDEVKQSQRQAVDLYRYD